MSNDLKRHIWSTTLCVLVAVTSKAQFSSGTDGFVVKGGTAVAVDGLTITPNDDLDPFEGENLYRRGAGAYY